MQAATLPCALAAAVLGCGSVDMQAVEAGFSQVGRGVWYKLRTRLGCKDMVALARVVTEGLFASQVPLTAVLLLFELTHDYFIIIPTLASVGISYWVASFPMSALVKPLSPLLRMAAVWLPQQQPPAAAALPEAGEKLQEAALAAVQDRATAEGSVEAAERPRNGARPPVQAGAAASIGDLAAMGISPILAGDPAQRNGASLRSGRPGSVVARLGAGHATSVRFGSGFPVVPKEATAGGNSANGAAGQQAIGNLPLAGRRDEVEDLTVAVRAAPRRASCCPSRPPWRKRSRCRLLPLCSAAC